MRNYATTTAVAVAFMAPCLATAQDSDSDIESLKQEIRQLDERLKQAEQRQDEAAAAAIAPAPVETAPTDSPSALNPAINLILSGIYVNLSEDPADYDLEGFNVSRDTEIGPDGRGVSLAESELGIYGNVDPYFYGAFTLALTADQGAEVEEAFIKTLGLSHGFDVKAGRFLSDIGYLNNKHSHTWDFVDRPLAYDAFLGGQLRNDGLQVNWLAPTETYFQIGAEIARGEGFPGSPRNDNGVGVGTIYAHSGGDIGISNSWRGGLSYLQASAKDREFEGDDTASTAVTNSFTGDSSLWVLDFVWKYAPNGNSAQTSLKLQGEYMYRNENGDVTYDVNGDSMGPSTAPFDATQSGWYLQATYKFKTYWRIAFRANQLDSGNVDYTGNNAFIPRSNYNPSRQSVALDFNPSEFSRIRLQYQQDKSRSGVTDDQIFVQYLVSLGAHGAHTF